MAQPFDPQRLNFTGPAVPVFDQELQDQSVGRTAFSVSPNGVMVFQSIADASSGLSGTLPRARNPPHFGAGRPLTAFVAGRPLSRYLLR